MELRILPKDETPYEHRLESDNEMIGRSFNASIKLADRSLSRKHARLFQRDGHWHIQDLGSQNGTLVNGRMITDPVPLQEGDQIRVGSTEITVLATQKAIPHEEFETESSGVFRSARDMLAGTTSSGVRFAAASHVELRRLAQQLALMNEVQQSLSRPGSLESAFELIIDRLFEYLEPEEGAVYLKQEGSELRCAYSRNDGGVDEGPLYSQNLVEQVMNKGLAAIVLDVAIDDRFGEAASIISRGVRSLVAAPMMGSRGAIGMIVLSSRIRTRQFNESDMELLTSMASVAAMKVVNERLAEEVLARERFDQELALARKIQNTLLPSSTPALDGWDVHGFNRPSRAVSGDFFRVVDSSERDRAVVVIADVSGKGFAAAMLTASLEALLMLPIETGMRPAEICRIVSRQLYERTTPERFTTAIVCALDRTTGTITLASAGHNPALHITVDGRHRWFAATGVPLGLLGDASYDEVEIPMHSGELLLLYTDGITEARNSDLEEYGEQRLLDLMSSCHRDDSETITVRLGAEVEDFANAQSFDDDRTIVAVKRL